MVPFAYRLLASFRLVVNTSPASRSSRSLVDGFGAMGPAILKDTPPSNDFPSLGVLLKTLNDDTGGFCTSSKALPEDFLL